jgi:chorismate dehydratase
MGAVSYLNTKPLLYGIERAGIMEDIELITDYPSRIADMLLNDEIDIGLVPVSIIPLMKEYYINTDYCIGSNGAVASVCLFSEVPITQVEKLLLDYQSRTSVQLARLLLKEYWKKKLVFADGGTDFREKITGTTAGVVIGDRALEQRKISRYHYDLGEAWKLHTGLPFVYAAWISNKKLEPGFIREFNEANKAGIGLIDQLVQNTEYHFFDLDTYYKKYISFELDEEKKQGMKLFLKSITRL